MRNTSTTSQGIQSVEIGGALLRALLARGSAMMLKDVAAAAHMPAAKAHRYLASFIRLGIVEQDPATGRYDLGPFALELGLGALARVDAVRIATRAITELSAQLDVTMAIAVWGNRGPTVVRWEEPGHAVTVNLRTGAVMPLLTSAMGRCFAAFLPPAQYQSLLRQELDRAVKSKRNGGPRSLAAFEVQLKKIRADGIARVEGTLIPGINALSAPVFDHRARMVVALTALGYEDTFDDSLAGPVSVALLATTRQLTRQLGGVVTVADRSSKSVNSARVHA